MKYTVCVYETPSHPLYLNSKITPIADLTYREIIKQKTPPPSRLEEILSSIGHQTNINIEIKDQGRGKEQIVEKVIDCLKRFNLVHNIIISSFNPQFIKHVKKFDDRLSTAWIWGDKNFYFFNQWKLILNYFKPQAIHIKNNLINDLINLV